MADRLTEIEQVLDNLVYAMHDGHYAVAELCKQTIARRVRELETAPARAIALTLAFSATTETKIGDAIPQDVWDALHAEGLLETVRSVSDEGDTRTTDAGRDELERIARAALALAEDRAACGCPVGTHDNSLTQIARYHKGNPWPIRDALLAAAPAEERADGRADR